MPIIWDGQELPILNAIVTSFQNWIGAMAGMTPSLAIQGLCCLPWYLRSYHRNSRRNEESYKAGRNAVLGGIDSQPRSGPSPLRCVSTSTCAVSIKPKIQKLKMNWSAQMGKSLDGWKMVVRNSSQTTTSSQWARQRQRCPRSLQYDRLLQTQWCARQGT